MTSCSSSPAVCPARVRPRSPAARSTRLDAVHLRIDTIEQAVVRSGLARHPVGPVGYLVGYALAEGHLRQGFTVIAESVNPLAVTRGSRRRAGAAAGTAVVEVEAVCPDEDEHGSALPPGRSTSPGLLLPDREQVYRHEYEPWNRDRTVLDTAGEGPGASLAALLGLLGDRPADVS